MPSDRLLTPPHPHEESGRRRNTRSRPIALATTRLGAELDTWARSVAPTVQLVTEINADVADQLTRRLAEEYFWQHPEARRGLRPPTILRHAALAILTDVLAEPGAQQGEVRSMAVTSNG